jgi:hypothetical protein
MIDVWRSMEEPSACPSEENLMYAMAFFISVDFTVLLTTTTDQRNV